MKGSSRDIFQNRSDFQKEMASLWRVVMAVVLAQVSSGYIAVIFKPYGFWFIDFWFGGAIASIFGFSIGLIWQMKAVRGSWDAHRQMLLFMGILSVALFVAAFVFPLELAAAQINESSGPGHNSSDMVPSAE